MIILRESSNQQAFFTKRLYQLLFPVKIKNKKKLGGT